MIKILLDQGLPRLDGKIRIKHLPVSK